MLAARRWLVLTLSVIAIVGASSAPVGAQPATPSAPPPPGALVFDATGHWLAGGFRAYWEAHGGLKQFGYPISPPVRGAEGTTVQWLERARFEYHPGLPTGQRVLLGLLGNEVTAGRRAEAPFTRVPDPGDGTWFEATGHTLRLGFRAHWQATGGLPVYGYPISEEFVEVNPIDQRPYSVQYFERHRLEWHPDLPAEYRVSLGLLGRQRFAGGGEVVAPPPDETPPRVVPPPAPPPAAGARVTAIGDSVMLGAAATLRQRIPSIEGDATVSRQLPAGVALIEARRAAGTLGPVVVVHLGNNNAITAAQFDQVMAALRGQRRVVVVNLSLPRSWETGNNAIINAGVRRYPNAVLADWKALAGDRPDFFWNDGIHLRPAGATAYADMVADALAAPAAAGAGSP
jgi:hypothetical protein